MIKDIIKVIALDPGITTGYASGTIEDGKLGVVSGQMRWNEYDLYQQLKFAKPDIIIYERFEYRSQKAYNVDNAELFPRNLIGVINLYAQERQASDEPLMEISQQMPRTVLGKNAYWSDARLKENAVYKTANPHANDGMRHLLYWAKFGPGFKYVTKGIEPLA